MSAEQLVVLAAGDSVYVFHPGDDRIDIQSTVLIGANLDVSRFHIEAEEWVFQVRLALEEQGVTIVDCRKTTEEASCG